MTLECFRGGTSWICKGAITRPDATQQDWKLSMNTELFAHFESIVESRRESDHITRRGATSEDYTARCIIVRTTDTN